MKSDQEIWKKSVGKNAEKFNIESGPTIRYTDRNKKMSAKKVNPSLVEVLEKRIDDLERELGRIKRVARLTYGKMRRYRGNSYPEVPINQPKQPLNDRVIDED